MWSANVVCRSRGSEAEYGCVKLLTNGCGRALPGDGIGPEIMDATKVVLAVRIRRGLCSESFPGGTQPSLSTEHFRISDALQKGGD